MLHPITITLLHRNLLKGGVIFPPNRMKIHRDLTQPNLTHHNAVTPPCLSILLHVATFHADPIVIDLQSVNCTDRLCKLTGAYSRGGEKWCSRRLNYYADRGDAAREESLMAPRDRSGEPVEKIKEIK